MAKASLFFSFCSTLMAAVFAYSASVQLNDLVNWAISSKTIVRQIAKVTILLDLSERVAREKTGSGLVIISLILHLEASSEPKQSSSRKDGNKKGFPTCVEYGMAILVTFSFGLPFIFFVVKNGEMRFDQGILEK
ncbi:hypothetical protein RCOM_0604340 [Ricinus communis]|uniref:CASP-like protein n=1 Tax=Ricinus communis TaxID=3988 RepID=B9S8S5_RICCO|nr:hypothetical protein RCOM_0604340 [Ricinus communis]